MKIAIDNTRVSKLVKRDLWDPYDLINVNSILKSPRNTDFVHFFYSHDPIETSFSSATAEKSFRGIAKYLQTYAFVITLRFFFFANTFET